MSLKVIWTIVWTLEGQHFDRKYIFKFVLGQYIDFKFATFLTLKYHIIYAFFNKCLINIEQN